MIDAGIWGQLPSIINAGVFAADEARCNFGGACKVVNGLASAGNTPMCASVLSVIIPSGGGKLELTGFFDYVVQVGDDLCAGCHSMFFVVDGTTYPFTLSNPHAFIRYLASNFLVLAALAPGSHTVQLDYVAGTTGVGQDMINLATLQVEVCPP